MEGKFIYILSIHIIEHDDDYNDETHFLFPMENLNHLQVSNSA